MAGMKDLSDKMTKLQEQLERLDRIANPPQMRALREHIERIINAASSPGMRAFQEQIDRVTNAANSPGMRAFQEQINRMTNAANSPGIRALQEKIDRVTNAVNSPSMLAIQEQISRMTDAANPPGMRAIQQQIDRMTNAVNSPGMRAFQEQLERVVVAANDSKISNWWAHTAVAYQELTDGSVLANYLVSRSEPDEPTVQTVEVEGFDSLEIGDWAELEVVDLADVDSQIVLAIQTGQVEQLPEQATQRLNFVIARIVMAWDMLLRIFNTCMAIVYLSALMSSATVPADVPKLAQQIPNEQREYLADYRIVNREGARLRSEPSTKSQALRSLTIGTLVEVEGYNDNGWYRVVIEENSKSVRGWIYVAVTTPVPKPKHPRGHFVVAEIE